jgi:thiamine biosynthesis lipoprotein
MRANPTPIGRGALALVALVFATLLLAGCRSDTPVYTTRFLAFGTLMDLSIVGVSHAQAERASQLLEQDFQFMHRAWHAWDPGPTGRVNRLFAEGKTFAAPPSVLPLIRLSRLYAEQSGHLFNPAIGHLVDLWGFHSDAPECHPPPAADQIRKLLVANPRMSDVHDDGILLRSDNPAVKLDFGAIGKGYGIDLAIGHLRELGIHNAIINAGGDLRAIGDRGGRPWRIAVRRPTGGVLGVIQVSGDESVFTSGDYERNFVHEGKTYHHIIDPRTGLPAEGTRSVTVVHTDATTADAAATALFVAGPEQWQEVARRMGVRTVLLMDRNGVLHMTPAMAARIELLDQAAEVRVSPPLDEPDPAAR